MCCGGGDEAFMLGRVAWVGCVTAALGVEATLDVESLLVVESLSGCDGGGGGGGSVGLRVGLRRRVGWAFTPTVDAASLVAWRLWMWKVVEEVEDANAMSSRFRAALV